VNQSQITIVLAVIKNEKGEVLLAKRNDPEIPSEHNKWEIMGGGIEYGENPVMAVKREVKEEANVEVEVVKLLPEVFSEIMDGIGRKKVHLLLLAYECKIISGTLKPNDKEIQEFKYVPIEKIKKYDCLPDVHKIAQFLK
jgi:8-oxo-dGTP diphosphatase